MEPPTLDDIRAARPIVYGALTPSPLLHHPLLADRLGCDVWVKHENHNPTGAFKVRGGVHLVSRLSLEDRGRGVISATTGNHGQSIAFAAARAGVPCTLVVPLNNNPAKNAMMRAWGATLIEHGRDFDEARELVEKMCEAQNLRYVHAANEPDLIAGVGTYALEIFEALAGHRYHPRPNRRRKRRVRSHHGARRARPEDADRGRRRRARRCRRAVVAHRNARRRRLGRHVRGRHCHPRHLRSHVRYPDARSRRLHHALGGATCRGRQAVTRPRPQPGRRRGRGGHCRRRCPSAIGSAASGSCA